MTTLDGIISEMQRTTDGLIRYLLAFQDAPWRAATR